MRVTSLPINFLLDLLQLALFLLDILLQLRHFNLYFGTVLLELSFGLHTLLRCCEKVTSMSLCENALDPLDFLLQLIVLLI